jgi:hypothetical protein
MKFPMFAILAMTLLLAHADEPVRVIGPIAGGMPATPSAPLPTLEVAPEDILDTRVHEVAEGTITLQKIAPVELPPLPEAPALPVAQRGASAPALEPAPASPLFLVSATTHHSTSFNGSVRTRFQWRSEQGESFTAWSNVDANWLGGFTAFEASGIHYQFLLTLTNIDLDQAATNAATQGRSFTPPRHPRTPRHSRELSRHRRLALA